MKAGCADIRERGCEEGRPAACPGCEGLGLCFTEAPGGREASHRLPEPQLRTVRLAFGFQVHKVGRGSTCRAVVRLGWHRRGCHKLSPLIPEAGGTGLTLRAGPLFHPGNQRTLGAAPAGSHPAKGTARHPLLEGTETPHSTIQSITGGCLQRGHTGAVGWSVKQRQGSPAWCPRPHLLINP